MAGLVLDSSVTMAWFLADELTAATAAVHDRIVVEGALVPALWRIETGNALLMAERRGRITAARRNRALSDLRRLQIDIDNDDRDRLWDVTLALAEQFRLTLYDARYLELAQRSGLPLASLDQALRQAAATLGIAVLPPV